MEVTVMITPSKQKQRNITFSLSQQFSKEKPARSFRENTNFTRCQCGEYACAHTHCVRKSKQANVSVPHSVR